MNSLTEINEPLTSIDFWGNEIYYPDSDGQPMAETDFHRNLILELIKTLEIFFAESPEVYVTGNIMFYYVEHDPKQVVSPDVMVFFGVPKGERRSYKTWEENDVVPSVVIEISSLGTWSKDHRKASALRTARRERVLYFQSADTKKSSRFCGLRFRRRCVRSRFSRKQSRQKRHFEFGISRFKQNFTIV